MYKIDHSTIKRITGFVNDLTMISRKWGVHFNPDGVLEYGGRDYVFIYWDTRRKFYEIDMSELIAHPTLSAKLRHSAMLKQRLQKLEPLEPIKAKTLVSRENATSAVARELYKMIGGI